MKALRIRKGDESWTIALEHAGVLSAIVNCIQNVDESEEDIELRMFGLDTYTNTHLRWNPVSLSVGDQVTFEVIEDCSGDAPDNVETRDLGCDLEARKQYIRSETAKLGGTINEEGNRAPT